MSGWKVVKLGYSRNPWRIVDSEGVQVTFESEVVNVHGGDELLPVMGYATKAECVDALGRCAQQLWVKLQKARGQS